MDETTQIAFERYQHELDLAKTVDASEAGTFWFTLETFWRLTLYFWRMMLVILAMVFILTLIAMTFGIIVGLTFSLGTLGMPASGSAQELFDNGVTIGNTIQSAFDTFYSEIIDLMQCKEILITTYNTLMRTIASILRLTFDAVNGTLGLGLPAIFTWARMARMERGLYDLHKANISTWVHANVDREIRHMKPMMPEAYVPEYLRAMRHKALLMERDLDPRDFPPIPEQLCDVFTALLQIISDLIVIFGDAVMKLFDILDAAFSQFGFAITFIEAVVQLIITQVLDVFPLTECFVDLNDLNNTPPSGYPALFRSQFFKHIMSCIFFLRFKGPLTPPNTPFSHVAGGDPVPNSPGSALAVALCPSTDFVVYPDIDAITVILDCFSITKLLNEVTGLYNYIYNTLAPLYDTLRGIVTHLDGEFTSLQGQFEDLLGQVRNLFRSTRNLEFDPKLHNYQPVVRPQWVDTHPIINLTMPISAPRTWNISEIGRHAQETMEAIRSERIHKTLSQRILEWLNSLSERTEADLYLERVVREYPQTAPDALVLVRAIKQIIHTVVSAGRNNHMTREVEDNLRPAINAQTFISINNIANTIRRANGDPEITPYADALMRAGPAVLFNPERFPRVVKELLKRHSNITAVEEGLMTLRYVPGFEAAVQELDEETTRSFVQLREYNRVKKESIFKEDDITTRTTEFSISVIGSSFSSFLSISGFALTSLSALGTIAVALITPIFSAFALIFPFVINLLTTIVSGVLNNTFSNAGSGNGILVQYDFFSPYIAAVDASLHNVFVNGFTNAALNEVIAESVEITKNNVNMGVNLFIRNQLCHIPLNFPPYTCPLMPLIDDEGLPLQTPPEYVIAILYFKQDEPCANPDYCDGGDCVSSGTPSRLCSYQAPCYTMVQCPLTLKDEICLPLDPNCRGGIVLCQIQNCVGADLVSIPCPATDGTYGKCNGWPLIRERMEIPQLQVTIFTQPNCYLLADIDFDTLRYQDGPVFQKYHFTWGWFRSSEFRAYFWAVTNVGIAFLKTVTRAILRIPKLPKIGLFAFTGAMPFFFIPNVFGYISLFTIASLSLQEFFYDTGMTIIHIGEFLEHVPLMGDIGTSITEFVRSPDYETNPPFGTFDSPGGILLCDLIALPAFMQFASVWATIFFLLFAFVASGGLRLVIDFFFDFGLLVFNYLFWVMRIFYVSTQLHQMRIEDMREPEPLKSRAVLRVGAHVPDHPALQSHAPKAHHGILPGNVVHVGAGLVAQLHANTHAGAPRHWFPSACFGALAAGRASFRLLLPQGWHDLNKHRVWNDYPSRAVSYAIYDHQTPRSHYNGFPLVKYLYDIRGTRLDEDAHVVIMPAKVLYRRHNDEHSVKYISLK